MFFAIKHTLSILISAVIWVQAQAATEINQATQTELEAIKGIGPGTSSKILAERQRTQFSNWDDVIDRVHGLGPKTAAKLSAAGLLVNGFAYVPKASLPSSSSKAAQPLVIAMSPSGGHSASATSGFSATGPYIRWSGLTPVANQVPAIPSGKIAKPAQSSHDQAKPPGPSPTIRPLHLQANPLKLRPAP